MKPRKSHRAAWIIGFLPMAFPAVTPPSTAVEELGINIAPILSQDAPAFTVSATPILAADVGVITSSPLISDFHAKYGALLVAPQPPGMVAPSSSGSALE